MFQPRRSAFQRNWQIAARFFVASVLEVSCAPMVHAQASPSAYTSGYRFDAMQRVVGTISPDPDGAGPLLYGAVRNTYDGAGRLTKSEKGELSSWKSESIACAALKAGRW